ncbi:hypothetical protein BLA14095_01350 [Burkholderia lata]|uniref:hypothetical protein n=1 Tax=Burkholderia lata (strain ATCC 17760 / DSM 23089 / LMG 22485 / NCIMB 9086 / R18194 / 383) TaxID=482957 RepID=UPI0014546BF3|nr:hypothetical protein [Burkholderia lata]VWB33983.1 hypothetical protein BLA14095_01350 [Burkholderia lata]
MSGWKLVSSLLAKHVGTVGDRLAQQIAAFDPETATQVDRDNLQAKLHEVAVKLAEAKQKSNKAQTAAAELKASIDGDIKASVVLIDKFEKQEINEATLTQFTDDLERRKRDLPQREAEADSARQLVETLQEILGTVETQLNEFDAKARAAMADLAQAQADRERAQLMQQQQDELNRLRASTGSASTGLGALQAAATQARVSADAAQTVASIGQKPLDQQAAVEEARRIAAGGAPSGSESVIDRLRRISQS